MPSSSSASGGIDNTFRRKWDRAEFEKKAAERVQREEAQLKARDKGKPASSASGKISGNEIIVREPLRRREEDLQLALNVGRTQVMAVAVAMTTTTTISVFSCLKS